MGVSLLFSPGSQQHGDGGERERQGDKKKKAENQKEKEQKERRKTECGLAFGCGVKKLEGSDMIYAVLVAIWGDNPLI